MMSKFRLLIAAFFTVGICLVSPATLQNKNPLTEVRVAGKGSFVIELYPKQAPKTVAHFLNLVEDKFFDSILFHRVVADFVAQAGDPESKKWTSEKAKEGGDGNGGTTGLGEGGSGKTISFEENDLTHEVGTLGMALTSPKSDTADSQFFINLKKNSRLNGKYCVFGKVTKGMEIVMKIERGDKIESIRVIQGEPNRS